MVLETDGHLTSQGPPYSIQVQFISKSWIALPKQLDHKCAECNCNMCSLEQESWVWLQAEYIAGTL